jgi:hypothetical protein
MSLITYDRLEGWIRVATLLALLALAWGVVAPGPLLGTAVLVLGLVGVALATAIVARGYRQRTLAQVVAGIREAPVGDAAAAPASGAGVRPGEGRTA